MKLPANIKIGAHRYKIVYPYTFQDAPDPSQDAQIDFARQLLVVKGFDSYGHKRGKSLIFNDFFHEIIHGVDRHFCMDKLGVMCDKEDLIQGLAEGFVQVLLDNGLLRLEKFGLTNQKKVKK